jgi:hypothetical protein
MHPELMCRLEDFESAECHSMERDMIAKFATAEDKPHKRMNE